MFAAVTDPGGRITGIKRTWLDRSRPDKAPTTDPRRALGHLLGNGVRFGEATDLLVAGEGIETMLALKSVLPVLPMIAALSASHLAALDLPLALSRLYVARDNDTAGLKAANRLRDRGIAAGIEIRELVPVYGDFNVDLCRLLGWPATGKPVRMRAIVVWHFRGDALWGETIFFDNASLLRQIGAQIETPPPAGAMKPAAFTLYDVPLVGHGEAFE